MILRVYRLLECVILICIIECLIPQGRKGMIGFNSYKDKVS